MATLLCWASLAVVCHVAAGAANASLAPLPRKPIEFSPSISLFFLEDVVPFAADPTSNVCIEQVKRSSAFNAKRLNFVITWYFVDDDRDSIPDKYCYRPRQNAQCIPFTQDVLTTWELGLQTCIKYAIDLGFDIFITPHVDDGGSGGGWRNAMKVDPVAVHGNITYKQILLDPVTRSLAKTARPGMKIWYSLQGEMNLAVMTYPQSYSAMMHSVKASGTSCSGPAVTDIRADSSPVRAAAPPGPPAGRTGHCPGAPAGPAPWSSARLDSLYSGQRLSSTETLVQRLSISSTETLQ